MACTTEDVVYILSHDPPPFFENGTVRSAGMFLSARAPPTVFASKSIGQQADAHNCFAHVVAQPQRAIPRAGFALAVSRTQHVLPTTPSSISLSKPSLRTSPGSSVTPLFQDNHRTGPHSSLSLGLKTVTGKESSVSNMASSRNSMDTLSSLCAQMSYLPVFEPYIAQTKIKESTSRKVPQRARLASPQLPLASMIWALRYVEERNDHMGGSESKDAVHVFLDSERVLDEFIRVTGTNKLRCLWTGCDQTSFKRKWDCTEHIKNVYLKLRRHKCTTVGCDRSFSTKG